MTHAIVLKLTRSLEGVQAKLSFEGWNDYPLFSSKKASLFPRKLESECYSRDCTLCVAIDLLNCFICRQGSGRAALLGAAVGCSLGFHACAFLGLSWWQCFVQSSPRLLLTWQWCAYASAVSAFHLSEYFTTALFNPTATNSDSFLVNHSTGYTAAALTSWTEFGLRLAFAPHWNFPLGLIFLGLVTVLVAQTIRSAAMITAGESFNHLIQTYKKENHVLITHGIYTVLRHPSYVGFFYWSIGLQFLLGNLLHAVAFAGVSWSFFQRRILFEEESLCAHFPDEYPAYVARTHMGIPFLRSQVAKKTKTTTNASSASTKGD